MSTVHRAAPAPAQVHQTEFCFIETTTNSSLLYFELVNFLGHTHTVLALAEHFRTRDLRLANGITGKSLKFCAYLWSSGKCPSALTAKIVFSRKRKKVSGTQ